MSGFVRRSLTVPTIQVIREIEGVFIIDLAPPEPATGAGTGAVCIFGEFEDGLFATDEDAKGAVEVFGSEDMRQKFGNFGYQYGTAKSQNPSSRRHLQELWNGNGFLKAFKLRAQRLFISRIDTSVGSVSFDPLACIDGGDGPFALPTGHTIDFTTDIGGPASSDAITGVIATILGGITPPIATIVSGDAFAARIDGGPPTVVTFSASDTTIAAVVTRINNTLGFTSASDSAGQLLLVGIRPGTGGSIELIDTVPGTLAKLGHAVGTTAGTGNVADINAVTVTELVTIINGSAALTAIQVSASVGDELQLRVCNSSPDAVSTILAVVGGGGDEVGLPESTTATAVTGHAGGSIVAGTRVRTAGALEFVTMQTLDIPAGVVGPFVAKVRPALDDGTALGTGAGTITVIVDAADFAQLTVSNAAALTAAKDENQMDNAYITALGATLDESAPVRAANFTLSSRRSDAVVREGRSNALKATACGLFARKFITGDPLGVSVNDAIANVANFRSDRVFYTTKGLKVRIPGIAELGLTGGLGFTEDGVITVRPDGPLTTLCAVLAPEENPGQQTNLIDDFFAVDTFGEVLTIDAYKAFRRDGISAPRVDRVSGTIFQSGVTSSLESGRKNMSRRKMADFIQDTAAELFNPFVKKLSKQSRRDKIRGIWEQFLASLQNEGNAEAARIEDFSVDDSENAGNTPSVLALGVYFIQTKVRIFASLDDIVIQTEIGESAVISQAA